MKLNPLLLSPSSSNSSALCMYYAATSVQNDRNYHLLVKIGTELKAARGCA